MAITVNSIANSLIAQKTLGQSANNLSKDFEKIGSGKRINSARDDAAGAAIVEKLNAEIKGFGAAVSNASTGIALTQTADGALSTINSGIQRIRELSVQAANGALSDSDRASLQKEVVQLKEEISNQVANTSFNGQNLLDSSAPLDFQVGDGAGESISINKQDLATAFENSGFNDIDISTAAGASSALSTLDTAIDDVGEARTQFGAAEGRFEASVESLGRNLIDSSRTRSAIEDADIAAAVASKTKNDFLNQIGVGVLAQANQQSTTVLGLLS